MRTISVERIAEIFVFALELKHARFHLHRVVLLQTHCLLLLCHLSGLGFDIFGLIGFEVWGCDLVFVVCGVQCGVWGLRSRV